MIVLLNRLIAVADGPIRDQVDVVGIREAIVAEVVTDGRHADRKGIKFAHIRKVDDFALHEEDVAHLEHINRMHVVVVLHISSVPLIDLANEAGKLGLIHLWQLIDLKLLQDVNCDHREGRAAAKVATEFQGIKVDVMDAFQSFFMFLDVVDDGV